MTARPKVSVLMAVRDGAFHLSETLVSLERQTFADFEVIVVDDGSVDTTPSVLDAWPDGRLVRLHNPISLGLAGALNRGLAVARGEYVARQDADDLAHPDRLARQVSYLDAHADIALLGSAYDVIDQKGAYLETQRQPTNDAEIRWQMLFHNAFCHSSVMLRRAQLEAFGLVYDQTLAYAQDYDLWSRLLTHAKAANLEEPLISLRMHPSSMSAMDKTRQQSIATGISARNIEAQLGAEAGESDVVRLRAWYYGLPERLPDDATSSLALLQKLLQRAGSRRARADWAERIALHPNMTLGGILPFLAAAPMSSSAMALLRRLFGRVACRPDRVRDL